VYFCFWEGLSYRVHNRESEDDITDRTEANKKNFQAFVD